MPLCLNAGFCRNNKYIGKTGLSPLPYNNYLLDLILCHHLLSFSVATVKMAEEHSDFVIGFICTSSLTSDPKFIHMTPGNYATHVSINSLYNYY